MQLGELCLVLFGHEDRARTGGLVRVFRPQMGRTAIHKTGLHCLVLLRVGGLVGVVVGDGHVALAAEPDMDLLHQSGH